MTQAPPVPSAGQSPFPIEEAPNASVLDKPDAEKIVSPGITAAKDAVAPLGDRVRTFARERPWATAALVGTMAMTVISAIRGRRN